MVYHSFNKNQVWGINNKLNSSCRP